MKNEQAFASHGADFWLAFSATAPQPLTKFETVLDFGCGCGRLARMFKGHPGNIHGCDIDERHIAWITNNLPYITALRTYPNKPLPYSDQTFDLVISISVFTHLNEPSQDFLLDELRRITKPEGLLMLTIHGARALERAINEQAVWNILSMEPERFKVAKSRFDRGEHAFVLQQGHLTTSEYEYGITFHPNTYILSHWSKWFHIKKYATGALHDFQDIIVLSPR